MFFHLPLASRVPLTNLPPQPTTAAAITYILEIPIAVMGRQGIGRIVSVAGPHLSGRPHPHRQIPEHSRLPARLVTRVNGEQGGV